MDQKVVQAWLESKLGERDDVESAVVFMAVENQLVATARWPESLKQEKPLSVAAKTAFSAKQAFSGTDPESGLRLNSHPIVSKGQVIGACALRLLAAKPAAPHLLVPELASIPGKVSNVASPSGSGLKPGIAPSTNAKTAVNTQGDVSGDFRPIDIAALLRDAIQQVSSKEAAALVVTEIAKKIKCERVSLGFMARRAARVVALSHGGDLKQKQALARSLASVMNESIDQASEVMFPQDPQQQPRITMAATRHCDQEGMNTTLCVPVVRGGVVVGALLCERKSLLPFSSEERECVAEVAASICSVIDLKHQGEIGTLKRIAMRLTGRRLASSKRTMKARWWLLAIAVLLSGLSLIPIQHRLTATARLEAKVQRTLSAPTDSFIKQVLARPGDQVKTGQVLVELADDDLQLEKRRLETEVARHEQAYSEALARQDRSQMGGLQGKVGEARAQLDLVVQQLQRTQVTAPFDGLIIKGDLREQLGAPVKRGDVLLTLSPSRDFRAVVEVDERDVTHVTAAQQGQITFSALPEQTFEIQIDRLIPMSVSAQGRTYFEAEARIVNPSVALRAGMEGVARIATEDRRLGWIVGHRFVDWVRMTLWTWGA